MASPCIWVGCAVGENAQQGMALAQRLVRDLRKAGAEVVSESATLPDEQFLSFLQRELARCQGFILVHTPQGIRSRRVQLAIQEVQQRLKEGALCQVCLVNASLEGEGEPALGSEMRPYIRLYTYNGDYPRLRDKLLLDLELLQIETLSSEEDIDDTAIGTLPAVSARKISGFRQLSPESAVRPASVQERAGGRYAASVQEPGGELYRAPSPFQLPSLREGLQQMKNMALKREYETMGGDRPVALSPFSVPRLSRRFWLYSAVSLCMALLIVSGVVLAKGMITSSAHKTPVTITHLTPPRLAPTRPAPTQAAPTQVAAPAIPVYPSGTVLAQDTFRRANATHWGTASDGQAWGFDGAVSPALSIVNNSGQVVDANPNTAAGTRTAYLAAIGPSAGDVDIEASAVVNKFATGSDAVDLVNFGVVARWQNDNMYKALIDGHSLYIFKYINNQVVRTPLASVSFAAQGGKEYTIRFEAIGAMLRAKVWLSGQAEPANWMVSATDYSYAQGQGGLRFAVQPGTQINVMSFKETAV
jgi:hypothetical protein